MPSTWRLRTDPHDCLHFRHLLQGTASRLSHTHTHIQFLSSAHLSLSNLHSHPFLSTHQYHCSSSSFHYITFQQILPVFWSGLHANLWHRSVLKHKSYYVIHFSKDLQRLLRLLSLEYIPLLELVLGALPFQTHPNNSQIESIWAVTRSRANCRFEP